jgi:hypothetical protein
MGAYSRGRLGDPLRAARPRRHPGGLHGSRLPLLPGPGPARPLAVPYHGACRRPVDGGPRHGERRGLRGRRLARAARRAGPPGSRHRCGHGSVLTRRRHGLDSRPDPAGSPDTGRCRGRHDDRRIQREQATRARTSGALPRSRPPRYPGARGLRPARGERARRDTRFRPRRSRRAHRLSTGHPRPARRLRPAPPVLGEGGPQPLRSRGHVQRCARDRHPHSRHSRCDRARRGRMGGYQQRPDRSRGGHRRGRWKRGRARTVAARERAVREFSLDRVMAAYDSIFASTLARTQGAMR